MKVAITGHTGGLGLALVAYFQQQGHEIQGFSRRTGHDITSAEHRSKIISEVKDFDIFVNNAYADGNAGQLCLLKDLYESWKDQCKTIINISSRFTYKNNFYCRNKREQDQFCQSKIYGLPRMLNLKPGLIDTPRVIGVQGPRMHTQQVIDVLDFALNNHVHSITFGK